MIKMDEKESGLKPVKLEEKKVNYSDIIEQLKQYFLSRRGLDKGEFLSAVELSKFHNADFFKVEPQVYSANLLKLVFDEILDEEKNVEKREYKKAVLSTMMNSLNEMFPEKSKDKGRIFCLFAAYTIGIFELFDE
jgi:F420-dependent methylenetetrahydromethanopterin dehydrogenase